MRQLRKNKINRKCKPIVSVLLAGYNEEAIIEENLRIIYDYMKGIESKYSWEIIFINDGSSDKTGELADNFASNHINFKVLHHNINMYLGCALRTGLKHAVGDYIITLDLDLSYSTQYIEQMIEKLSCTKYDVVIASPYMKGGKVIAVPFIRKLLSRVVNWFISIVANANIHTFTGMVRGYKGSFIKSLNLKSRDFEINPEIIYKALLLRAQICEIPANLDWSNQKKIKSRTSSIRMIRGILSGFMSAFIFRPYVFYLSGGLLLGIISFYIFAWLIINICSNYPDLNVTTLYFDDRFSRALAETFQQRPHAFLIGGFTFVISTIIVGIGVLSLQTKRYFEETFHINTSILKNISDS